jgi:hypothetical protein
MNAQCIAATNRHYDAYKHAWSIEIQELKGSNNVIWRFYLGADMQAWGVEPTRAEAFAKANHRLKVHLGESMFPGGPKAT